MIKKLLSNEALFDDYLLEYRQRSDKIMTYQNWFLTFITLALTPLYNTYSAFFVIAIPTMLLSIYLEKNHSGELITRLFMGASFMIFTGLIIHQNFGDIEAHFSAFGLIGVLLYYRDWRVIVTALVVIALHHLILGYIQTLGVAIYVFDAQNYWELFFLHVGYFIPFIAMMLYLSVWLRREGYDSVLINKHLEIQIKERTKELEEKNKKLEKLTFIDGLTRIFNRNKFDEIFASELKSAIRFKEDLTVAILDIDNFKKFNDKYGHLIGDEVLIKMAQTLDKRVRDTDTFARWGGEEFVILFKHTDAIAAKIVAETLKDSIEVNEHPIAGKITASFGITQYKSGDTLKSMFQRCDEALYIAKENGRNRVELI